MRPSRGQHKTWGTTTGGKRLQGKRVPPKINFFWMLTGTVGLGIQKITQLICEPGKFTEGSQKIQSKGTSQNFTQKTWTSTNFCHTTLQSVLERVLLWDGQTQAVITTDKKQTGAHVSSGGRYGTAGCLLHPQCTLPEQWHAGQVVKCTARKYNKRTFFTKAYQKLREKPWKLQFLLQKS